LNGVEDGTLKLKAGGFAAAGAPNGALLNDTPPNEGAEESPNVGADAPNVGAVDVPNVGAVGAPKGGAGVTPNGAVAPNVGTEEPKAGADAPNAGVVAEAPNGAVFEPPNPPNPLVDWFGAGNGSVDGNAGAVEVVEVPAEEEIPKGGAVVVPNDIIEVD